MASPPPARGGRGASQRLRVRHSDVGGGGAGPPGPSPALLPDHRRFSIRGRVYPAILPARGHAVSGKVLKELTDRELHVFDMFEDEEMHRRNHSPTRIAYIWGNERDPDDLHGEWDFEEWRKVHLKDYLEMTEEFMQELGQF
ncbi:unnamed protein product [Miscanthus lutarioriparius]|uniref:Gamma-glutamylcyclotransferase AIG2-like domain-containing protein n=1 Tax=Miscanthus lutarioriparius TaxID=422564 RepID=A0A811Q8T7_9POAL|nr:unnamed protein product [Miscanthus lutarioriparius]